MKRINDDNIDEIMFALLEGEITGLEREQLLAAIEADPAYAALWKTWQQTILPAGEAEEVMDTAKLRRKKKKGIMIRFSPVRYAAAAAVVIGICAGIYRMGAEDPAGSSISMGQPRTKSPVSRVPELIRDSSAAGKFSRDTFVPLREKIRYMAEKPVQPATHVPEELPLPVQPAPGPEAVRPNDTGILQTLAGNEPAITPEADKVFAELPSVQNENVLVSVSEEEMSGGNHQNLLSRIFGGGKIRISRDSSSGNNRKLILENRKYQIIAGF